MAACELDISKSLRDYNWTKKFSVSESKKMGHIRLGADLSSKPPFPLNLVLNLRELGVEYQ